MTTRTGTANTKRKPAIPVPGERNILITSALPYVNNVPHLGNIIGAVLSADVYARYCRQRGYNTLYICGTDEYGTATETKALEEGVTPQEICSKYYEIHRSVYEWFDISFDYFGRTSTDFQTQIAQDIFLKLHQNDLLIKETIEQLYDPVINRFLADRFISGTCPNCGYNDARGDQCDQCGKLLNPTELIDYRSALSKAKPILKETTHLFLDLPKLQEKVKDWFEKSAQEGEWSEVAKTITLGWLNSKEGLKPRCITRDLSWGTPVPLDEFKEKVFYVWFDAPIGYISITANLLPTDWEKWWKDPENVKYFEFMGKDNVPFHSIIFPASLIGSGDNWTTVNSLSSTEYLNYEDGKFSKSRNIGVFGNHAQETGIPSEVWRYYLLLNRPESADTVFSWEDFVAKNNNELLANLGNFVNRVLKFISEKLDRIVPQRSELNEQDNNAIKEIETKVTEYIAALEKVKLKEGLKTVMEISRVGNQYMQENKPWDLLKTDRTRCGTVVNVLTQVVRLLTSLAEPYLPAFSQKVLTQLNLYNETELNCIEETFNLNRVPSGHEIGNPEPLFMKMTPQQAKDFRTQFGGASATKIILPIDLRIGQIEQVKEHPNADHLYLLNVRVGEKETRQIVAGLRNAYPNGQELVGKKVVVACNLKHAKMKGEKSEGMLIAAKFGETNEPNTISLLIPKTTKDVPVGTKVVPKGATVTLEKVIDPKTLKTLLKNFLVGDASQAEYSACPLKLDIQEDDGEIYIVTERQLEKGAHIF
jgi:methionyl-tRNA synthetase